jgi:hypothetical protein
LLCNHSTEEVNTQDEKITLNVYMCLIAQDQNM